jgi:TetR/AcrR family transcriptional regulator
MPGLFAMAQSPTKVKRERNPEETRRRILDAAEAEFARKGYDGTRLRDVALAVGVHHALLHHYFKDKEGLFRAVLERAIESVSSRAFAVLRSTGDLSALTESFVETLVDFLAENKHLALILHFASLDEGSPAYSICEEIGFRLVHPLVDATASALRAGQAAGTIRDDIDPKSIVIAGLGLVAFPYHADMLIRGIFARDMRAPAEVVRHKKAAIALILDGVLKR